MRRDGEQVRCEGARRADSHVILSREGGVVERREEAEDGEDRATLRANDSPSGLERSVRSPRLFPHEIVALAYVAAGVVILERLPVTYPRQALALAGFLPVTGFVACAVAILVAREILRRLRGRPRRLRTGTEALLLLRAAAVLVPVLSMHFLLKSFIWLVNPRTWDAFLWDVDRFLHLGISPSLFLTTAFSNGAFLQFIDIVYSNIYFMLMVVSVPVLLIVPDVSRRMAFLAAYAFLWMAGSALYLLFPSWGPVFVIPSVFGEVLRYMPSTMDVQEALFREISSLVNAPLEPRIVRFGSVAAFPSLHLAVVTVFAAASRQVSRAWFVANVVIVLLMLLGSVITGYHYLVDGWAGIALGLGAWALGRRLFPDDAGGSEDRSGSDRELSDRRPGQGGAKADLSGRYPGREARIPSSESHQE